MRGAALGLVLCGAVVPAAQAGMDAFVECAQKFPDSEIERLKCYDGVVITEPGFASLFQEDIIRDKEAAANPASEEPPEAAPKSSAERSYFTRAWNLDNLSNLDPSKLGRLQPHRQNYLLVRRTNNPNTRPVSPIADHNTPVAYDLDSAETKFQLSFKADIGSQQQIDFLGIKTFRMWLAYTQQSHWQILNSRSSSPFRETNYEPELIATLGTGNAAGLKLINLGWVHQSNGRPLPESRSWNRLYLQGGWEWKNNTSFMVRGWRRLSEDPLKDDNPDIGDYAGKGDFVARWEPRDKSQAVAILLRNNLRNKNNRSFVQIDWATPAKFGNAARVHVQLTSGYGESMIDYNHHQTTFGLGFSFREW
ncbi:MAG: phospholipase A [Gallionella sp.]|nr:phospholipase A [Gallionella sp.]